MDTRTYTAYTDDGHDFGHFEFESRHRLNSKALMKDAEQACIIKYGFRRAKHLSIYHIEKGGLWG